MLFKLEKAEISVGTLICYTKAQTYCKSRFV